MIMEEKISYQKQVAFPVELYPSRMYYGIIFIPLWLLMITLVGMGFLVDRIWFVPSLVILVIALYKYLSFILVRYLITEETITVRRGIFSRQFDYLQLFRIRDYRFRQSLFMRLLGVVELTLYTTDLTTDLLILKALPKSDLPDLLRKQTLQARLKNNIVEIN